LNRDLQSVQASTDTLKEELEAARASATAARYELSSKSTAFDELVVWDLGAVVGVHSEDIVRAWLLFIDDDLFDSGPCSGVVEESYAWSWYGAASEGLSVWYNDEE
jgi:hypothetical protein